jgi:hypothetical protein
MACQRASVCTCGFRPRQVFFSSSRLRSTYQLVGKVIGKKGSVITHLQLTTQTEVVVLTLPDNDLFSPVVITGEPHKAIQAFELINDIVEGRLLFPVIRLHLIPPPEADDIVVEFPVPRQKIHHGLFYGNHHEAVKHLSASTNVRINVPDGHVTAHHQISLEGAADNVFRALTKFAEVISNPDYATARNHSTSASKDVCLSPMVFRDGLYEQTVKIPSPIVGVLLVRHAGDPNVIHQIRQLTHTAIIKLDSPDSEPSEKGDQPTASAVDTEAEESVDAPRTANGTSRYNPKGYEIFAVRGSKEADVALASSVVARIIVGEKIYGVMTELKALRERRREPGDLFSGRGGGRGSGRVARGRGVYGAPRGAYSTSHTAREGEGAPRGADERQRVDETAGESGSSGTAEAECGGDAVEERGDERGVEDGESDADRGGRRGGRTSRGGRVPRGGGRVRMGRGREGRGRGREGRGRSFEESGRAPEPVDL